MKHIILSAVFLIIVSMSYAQSINDLKEKWTCYTDDEVLLMDDHQILGAFEYVDGSFWIVTNRGINIFDGEQWKKIENNTDTMKNSITSFLVDSKDRIWIGTGSPRMYFPHINYKGGGVVVYDGKEWNSMENKDIGIKVPIVTRIFETSSGDIWMAVSSVEQELEKTLLFKKGALLRYSNNEWTVYKGKDIFEDILCSDCIFIKGFYEDANGKSYFWSDDGLFYFENDSFHKVGKDQGYNIRDKRINAVFEDSEKNLWLGAPARVAMFNGEQWKTFNRKNGLPESSWWPLGFSETRDNKIILSMTNGIYTFDGTDDQWTRGKKRFVGTKAHVDNENRIWVPTSKGLEIKDGDEWSNQKDLKKVWRIMPDNDDGVWALTKANGAKLYKNSKWSHYTEKNILPSDKIRFGHVTKDGTVWIGTKKGICKCEYDAE